MTKTLMDMCFDLGLYDNPDEEPAPEVIQSMLDILKHIGQRLGPNAIDFSVAFGYLWGGYSTTLANPAAAPAVAPPASVAPQQPEAQPKENLIGEKIYRQRKHKRMTQVQLGLRIGVSNITISRWERGLYTPSAIQQQWIDEVFGAHIQLPLKGCP